MKYSRRFLGALSSHAPIIYVAVEVCQFVVIDTPQPVTDINDLMVKTSLSVGPTVSFSSISSPLGDILVNNNCWLPSFLQANVLFIQPILTASHELTGSATLIILCRSKFNPPDIRALPSGLRNSKLSTYL